jgi:choline dehydrogenase-like flavoprotein
MRAGAILVAHARRILHRAGALATVAQPILTFSHALGTVRMGRDPRTSPLDGFGCFRGLENLSVSDGSALPTAAAVNPSLTIAASALRVGAHVAEMLGARSWQPATAPAEEAVA